MKRVFVLGAALAVVVLVCPGVSNAQDVKIYGTISPPANYMLDGKYTGTTVAIVEELKHALGVTTEIEVVPIARAMEYVEHTPNVMLLSFAKTSERVQAGFHFVGPVVTRAHTIWKKKGSPIVVKSLDDLKSQNLTVGTPLGDFRSKLLKDAGIAVEEVRASELNLRKLMAGHVPLMVSSNFEMLFLAKSEGVNMADVEPVYMISEASSYLMFSKDTDRATLEKWRTAYAALEKTDLFTKVADKWAQTLGASLRFAPDKGFYIP